MTKPAMSPVLQPKTRQKHFVRNETHPVLIFLIMRNGRLAK